MIFSDNFTAEALNLGDAAGQIRLEPCIFCACPSALNLNAVKNALNSQRIGYEETGDGENLKLNLSSGVTLAFKK